MGDARLDYLFHHIFLPTQLPQQSDGHNGQGDQALLDALLESIGTFRAANDHAYYQLWSTIQRSLRTFATLHSKGKPFSRSSLKEAFQDATNGEIIILHIALQNSGLVIQKKNDGYVIETFEASPQSANVLAAKGALEWDFPSQAVVIPSDTFEDDYFRDGLVGFLEKASLEPVKQYAATTLKAGSNAYESRDTTSPTIIGQLLITILKAAGRKHNPTLTRKRVRDEVCWGDGAENPWRRNPRWLVLRISIQRVLCSLLGAPGIFQYKFFMCSFISSLCHRFCTQVSLPADRLTYARMKLARRVAKLEAQGIASSPELSTVIQSLFKHNRKVFLDALQTLEKFLENRGTQTRIRHIKKMYRLPKRATPDSTILSLCHSRATLNEILTEVYYGRPRAQMILPQSQPRAVLYSTWVNNSETNIDLTTTDYFCLADMEAQLAQHVKEALAAGEGIDLDGVVLGLRHQSKVYQARAYQAYKENAEQLSLMILNLLELWMALDTLAVRRYPLLVDYDPGLPVDIMHPLKVAKLSDMFRLTRVEEYLEGRRRQAIYPLSNAIGDLNKTCFAVRYFDQCGEMQKLTSTILDDNESAKAQKNRELVERSAVYEKLIKEASETACLYTELEYDPLTRQHNDRRHNDRHCRKCYVTREASRMRIDVYEDLLPTDDTKAKAIAFELLLPSGFAAWRDSVWQILTLARGDSISDRQPQLLLLEYKGLKRYANSTQSSLTLASRTKSFYQTHYTRIPFPAQLDQVCLPHGLKYGVYDKEHGLWTSRHSDKPSFAAICSVDLPLKSAWVSVKRFLHPTFDGVYPSANEVVASQTRCPNSLTVAEYSCFQDLRIGTRIQWIKLLRELASSNINFGSVETTILVTELALGVGPPGDGHVLRAAHWVFRNQLFCQHLAGCIRRRLQAIATNWREGQIVECLFVLVQRLWSFGQTVGAINEAQELMLLVRKITNSWIRMLRREICNAVDVETAQARSRESFHAALLCRKTFILEAARADLGFQHAALTCFLECAFTIKDNLSLSESGSINKMPPTLRRLYVSDLKLIHSLEPHIRWSLQHVQSAVSEAVNNVWMEAEGPSARMFTTWTIQPAPHDSWCTAQSRSGEGVLDQNIQFNFIEGTLYIDGQLLGRLPEEYARQDFFKQFFGNRTFLTRPSYLQGLSYMFVSPVEGHEIHFGFRNGYRFMRVRPRSSPTMILEFLPAVVFLKGHAAADVADLPLPLVQERVHWLDIQAHTVEIRPHATMWRARPSDWRIDLRSSQGWRRNKSQLVDPRSSAFLRIAQLIEPFEHRSKMIIYQPVDPNLSIRTNLSHSSNLNLTVDLPALELTFRVSFDGLLESRQLRAYIDMDQDAGTLYGLKSSLVLRDSVLQDNRSILVAMGPASITRDEAHVNVFIKHTGFYARFAINKDAKILGICSYSDDSNVQLSRDYFISKPIVTQLHQQYIPIHSPQGLALKRH
ncbi:MAG: hypothetical protein Q9178_002861 [Gyalolechia marmorata]